MDKVLHDPAQLHFTDHGFSVKMPYSRSEDKAFDILATFAFNDQQHEAKPCYVNVTLLIGATRTFFVSPTKMIVNL